MADYRPDSLMTVQELVNLLQMEDPGALVLVDGYEGGFQSPDVYLLESVALTWEGSYQGPFHSVPDGVPAVVVSRGKDER